MLATAALVAMGQGLLALTLGSAQAVDLRVTSVQWHPFDRALLYRRDEATGTGLGLFAGGDSEGKVVLHLAKEDEWQLQWFASAPEGLLTVTHREASVKRVSLYLLDARRKTATELYARAVPADRELSLLSELSPLLVHAIVSAWDGQRTTHYVMPNGGGRLVLAPDIDAAQAKGLNGPAWTRRGTAAYGDFPNTINVQFADGSDATAGVFAEKMSGTAGTIHYTARIQLQTSDSDAPASPSFRFVRVGTPTLPAEAKEVLEVTPSNGVIRPVRSPGPWSEMPTPPTSTAAEPRTMGLDVAGLRTETSGLCLIGGPKTSPWRTLVAPKAEWGLLAPQASAVAYAVDGALFVRPISGR